MMPCITHQHKSHTVDARTDRNDRSERQGQLLPDDKLPLTMKRKGNVGYGKGRNKITDRFNGYAV